MRHLQYFSYFVVSSGVESGTVNGGERGAIGERFTRNKSAAVWKARGTVGVGQEAIEGGEAEQTGRVQTSSKTVTAPQSPSLEV